MVARRASAGCSPPPGGIHRPQDVPPLLPLQAPPSRRTQSLCHPCYLEISTSSHTPRSHARNHRRHTDLWLPPQLPSPLACAGDRRGHGPERTLPPSLSLQRFSHKPVLLPRGLCTAAAAKAHQLILRRQDPPLAAYRF